MPLTLTISVDFAVKLLSSSLHITLKNIKINEVFIAQNLTGDCARRELPKKSQGRRTKTQQENGKRVWVVERLLDYQQPTKATAALNRIKSTKQADEATKVCETVCVRKRRRQRSEGGHCSRNTGRARASRQRISLSGTQRLPNRSETILMAGQIVRYYGSVVKAIASLGRPPRLFFPRCGRAKARPQPFANLKNLPKKPTPAAKSVTHSFHACRLINFVMGLYAPRLSN